MKKQGRAKQQEQVRQRARERLLEGVPVTERQVHLAGVTTTVLEGGQGSPLVLLHGGIESGGVYWAPVISRLAESHRVVVPDLPGLGESAPAPRLDAEFFADWFAQLFQVTGMDKPTVIAHSLLGSMDSRFAAEHSDLLGRLVIYAAPAIGPYRVPLGLMVIAIRFSLRPTERNSERFNSWGFHDFDRARRRDPEWYGAWDDYVRERGAVPHVKRTMRRLIKTETKQIPEVELRNISCPTALLWGRHDRFVSLQVGESASDRFGWPLHVVEETGHVPHIERPGAFLRAFAEIEATQQPRKAPQP
ncbi:MAG: alpha/beta hydrolase [Nocardioidaceae bacterium]